MLHSYCWRRCNPTRAWRTFIKKKTKSEIRDIVDSLEKNHRDPDNQGAYLVPALWRHKTPFAGTFVFVNNDLEPEEKSILSGPSSIGKKILNTNINSECHQSSDKRTCIHFNFRLKVASDWLHIMFLANHSSRSWWGLLFYNWEHFP